VAFLWRARLVAKKRKEEQTAVSRRVAANSSWSGLWVQQAYRVVPAGERLLRAYEAAVTAQMSGARGKKTSLRWRAFIACSLSIYSIGKNIKYLRHGVAKEKATANIAMTGIDDLTTYAQHRTWRGSVCDSAQKTSNGRGKAACLKEKKAKVVSRLRAHRLRKQV
jgi:hypothetical protein